MSTMGTALRQELQQARRAYLDDLQWLRSHFGIIPELPSHLVNAALSQALDALESSEVAQLSTAIKAFKRLHRGMMKGVAWRTLEAAREDLCILRENAPDRFESGLVIWNHASEVFTNFVSPPGQSQTAAYRMTLETLKAL